MQKVQCRSACSNSPCYGDIVTLYPLPPTPLSSSEGKGVDMNFKGGGGGLCDNCVRSTQFFTLCVQKCFAHLRKSRAINNIIIIFIIIKIISHFCCTLLAI